MRVDSRFNLPSTDHRASGKEAMSLINCYNNRSILIIVYMTWMDFSIKPSGQIGFLASIKPILGMIAH